MSKQYREKPYTIEAIQFTGTNHMEIIAWASKGRQPESNALVRFDGYTLRVIVPDQLAAVQVMPNDFVIKCEKNNSFDVIKPDYFAKVYEEAKDYH